MKLRDRIKELRRVPASELLPNPKNWRTHPKAQADAMRGVLAEIGIADAVLARETPAGLMLIDGHLRTDTVGDNLLPVLILDVNEAEADKLLATLDPLAAMAEADPAKLDAILREVETASEDVAKMLAELAAEAGLYKDGGEAKDEPKASEKSQKALREKYGTEAGQQWTIANRHRLLIGDSTDTAAINSLRPQGGWDGILTDPPYEFDAERLDPLLRQFVACVLAADSLAFRLAQKWDFRLDLIWEHRLPKKLPLIYHAHVLILASAANVKTGWKKPRPDFGSIIRTEQEYLSSHGHGKSSELFRQMLAGFEWREVVDPFAGSGGTLIACEQDGRTWTGIELSPEKAAVCLERASAYGLRLEREESESA